MIMALLNKKRPRAPERGGRKAAGIEFEFENEKRDGRDGAGGVEAYSKER